MSDMTSTSSSNRAGNGCPMNRIYRTLCLCNIVANVAVFAADAALQQCQLQRTSSTNVISEFWVRKRRHVEDIYKELGPVFFRRVYRMQYCNFETLADELSWCIVSARGQKEGYLSSSRFIPNGPIMPDVRLACAMRWFSAASSYDLMTTYGTGHTDTIKSFWYVIDAINRNPQSEVQDWVPKRSWPAKTYGTRIPKCLRGWLQLLCYGQRRNPYLDS